MAQLASLDWSGPIEPLVRKIAASSDYKVRILGNQPSIPVIVQIHQTNVPLADILRNASFQTQNRADITVYPANKVIELRYYNT